ncbi:MAG: radical SAM family heme chaperone HemW, partial [Bacteroidales bacterium]|nr:radical SAM family heme chaperone HemW [Bacteroidales bacterium]
YIHIPFCVQKCSYCNFFSTTTLQKIPSYIEAVKQELLIRKDYLPAKKIDSLYFGGGTPSLLPVDVIADFLAFVEKYFDISQAEITLEANPNNLTETYLLQLHQTPVNRLSIGIQSFCDEHLQLLKRVHSAKMAEQSIELAQKIGFDNLSVDLIYGIPDMTLEQWQHNLQKVKDIPHISCYSLTVEDHTLMASQMKKGIVKPLHEDILMEQIAMLLQFADRNGFRHYEISNFCKPNCFSRHNYAYWQQKPYLGLGAAAHSYNINSRQWNVAHVDKYVKYVQDICMNEQQQRVYARYENLLYEKEILSPVMRLNEYLMTALRTDQGVDLDKIESMFLPQLLHKLSAVNADHYIVANNHIALTRKGFLFADNIAAKLFFEENEM